MENSVITSNSETASSLAAGNSCNFGNGSSPLSRKIEFHPARKQFNGFIRNSAEFRMETLNPDSGRRRVPGSNPSQPGKKANGSEFVENGLDPELSLQITFRRIGAGLQNLGNTCFLNSVLQCLTYTEPLAAYLQSGKHQNSCHIAGFCALCAIQKHVSRALQSTGRSLVPKDLVSNLRCISRTFRNARQEDAHEYTVNLLESMHKCCLPSGVPSESPAAYEKSLVHKIFGGRLRSQVECQQCFYCSNKFDPFLDLSLEIFKAETLPVALRNFTAAELLDGGEKHYQCQRCRQKVRAKKRLTIHKAPYVLTIHLKRFHAHDPGRKIDKKVRFDSSLDLKPFVSGSYDEDLKYNLYGVLVHFGHSTHSGHYVCFVRTSSGMWYFLDDNNVRQVSEKTVLDQKAYMLFYVRDRKSMAPGKPVEVVQKENIKATASSGIANLAFKQLSKDDNCSIGKRLGALDSSGTMDQKGVLNFGTSRDTLRKEAPLPQINGLAMAEGSVLLADSLSNQSKGVSSLRLDLGECLPPSAPSQNSNFGISKHENGTVTKQAGMSDCNVSSCSNGPQNSVAGKLIVDESLQKGGDTHNKGDAGISASNQTGEQVFENGAVESQNLPVISKESLHRKAPDCTPHKKMKQKLLKCRISKMHFGFHFFRASLGLWKKKKHKKSKRCTLDTENLIKEQFLDNNHFPSDMGPSTSQKSPTVAIVSTSSRNNGAKSGSKKRNDARKCNGDLMMDVVDGEFRGRNNQNGTVLATEQIEKSSISIYEANQQDQKEHKCVEISRKDAFEDRIDTPTQGLEVTTVARWDGINLPPSGIMESNSVKDFRIGYVGDEWDEEYDRGKRKKVRHSTHDFGGPNPFQEIATKKAQFLKKAKMDRCSSGNQPFRI